jgi:hypothetical protein
MQGFYNVAFTLGVYNVILMLWYAIHIEGCGPVGATMSCGGSMLICLL